MKALLFVLSLAWAGSEDGLGEGDDDLVENTVGGRSGGGLPVPPGDAPPSLGSAPAGNRLYDAKSYAAAEILQVPIEFAAGCRHAIDLIYQRRYPEARRELDALDRRWPSTGIGPVGLVIVYQSLMFENYDFRYEKPYRMASAEARRRIGEGIEQPGFEAVERFLLAGMLGVDGIHAMRKGEYLAAVNRAWEAIGEIGKVKELAPRFVDARLGDGMYLYWRTIVSRSSRWVPKFEDRRAEGIELLRQAERDSVFLAPAATLALAYSYVEERQLEPALARVENAHRAYPDNVIVSMTGGRLLASMRRHEAALAYYDEVLRAAPDNQRVHYHRGVVLHRVGRLAEAEAAFVRYVSYPDVTASYRGQTWYRLGLVRSRMKDWEKAAEYYRLAVRESGNKAARRALERLAEEGKSG